MRKIILIIVFLSMAGMALAGEWEKSMAPSAETALREKMKINLLVFIQTKAGVTWITAKFNSMEVCKRVASNMMAEKENVFSVHCETPKVIVTKF